MDIQASAANSHGEKVKMITLASAASFLGTVWFIALVGVSSFGAGMVFKDAVLRIITRGK